MSFTLRTLFLIAAVVFFILAGLNVARPWFNPLGFGWASIALALVVW